MPASIEHYTTHPPTASTSAPAGLHYASVEYALTMMLYHATSLFFFFCTS
jgi:hypothetical protein